MSPKHHAPVSIETERLTGQPTSAAHLDCAAEVFGDPEVAAWVWPGGLGGPRTREQAAEILAAQTANWSRDGFGWWWWRERDSGRMVGEAGLQHSTIAAEPVVEIGWTLLPEAWGRGFATEAATAVLEFAFERVKLQEVVAVTMVENDRSLAVMRRLGMEPAGRVDHLGLPHERFRLARQEWLSRVR
jgi:RimJ/RimL family protein N-acetyltransferase